MLLYCVQREVSQTQQVPPILLVPTNTVLLAHLRASQTQRRTVPGGHYGSSLTSAVQGSRPGASREQHPAAAAEGPVTAEVPWQQLVDDYAAGDAAGSLVLLHRHGEHVRP